MKTRESKMFWVVCDGFVLYALCYSCPPNDNCWWCPVAGFSGVHGQHMFDTRDEAYKRALELATENIWKAHSIRAKLKAAYELGKEN